MSKLVLPLAMGLLGVLAWQCTGRPAPTIEADLTPAEIQGHTESVVNPVANRMLSQQRADATKAYLHSKGIEAGRLTAVAYGSDCPIADNATADGRQSNRRIEFSLKEVVIKS